MSFRGFSKIGIRLLVWAIVLFLFSSNISNLNKINELEKKNYVSVPNFTYNGNIPRFQYTVKSTAPDVCSGVDVGNVSRFFNNFGGNFDQSFRDWRHVLSNLVVDDDANLTANLKETVCLLSRTSGLQNVQVTTKEQQNTTAQFFYRQFKDPISKWVYGLSITIGMLFFFFFIYKILVKVGVFKWLSSPFNLILYFIEFVILFSVLIGFAFKEDEIMKTTGASDNVNERTSKYYRVLTGYIVTFFAFIVFANFMLFSESTGGWYKFAYDQSIVFLIVLTFFVLIIMPYLFVFASFLFYILSQSFKSLSEYRMKQINPTNNYSTRNKNWCNGSFLMPEIYKNSWTLPFFQILLGFIEEFVDSNETNEEIQERRAATRNTNKIKVDNKIRKRLRNALEARDLKQSSIENDSLF